MILGLGLDLVSLDRMANLAHNHGNRFLDRCFVPGEIPGHGAGIPVSEDHDGLVLALARVWVLKEAFLKALGGEIRDIPYRDITVDLEASGGPRLHPTGRAAKVLADCRGRCLAALSPRAGNWVTGTVVLLDGQGTKGLGGNQFLW